MLRQLTTDHTDCTDTEADEYGTGWRWVGRSAYNHHINLARKRRQTPGPLRLKSWFAHRVGIKSPFLVRPKDTEQKDG